MTYDLSGNTKYATGGAVRQDGPLAISLCKTCGREIVFATSKRTGKKYPVCVQYGRRNQPIYAKHDIHKCDAPNGRLMRAEGVAS